MAATFEQKFYTLPAEQIVPGMSTDDGQDILTVELDTEDGKTIWMQVYTPRSDDPEQDEENRREPEWRTETVGTRASLCTFSDTEVDGSTLPDARVSSVVPVQLEDDDEDDYDLAG